MSKHHRRHGHRHRHYDAHRLPDPRGPVSYGIAGFGWGYGTAQSGIHDCLSGQQFPADQCPADASGGTDAGAASGDAGGGGGDASGGAAGT